MNGTVENLIEQAAADIAASSHAIALTGAGMSTESQIPDFRGPSGIWTKDPEAERRAYEAYPKFLQDPKSFWEETLTHRSSFFTDIQEAMPNPGHHALVELETMGYLSWVITQNIDALHEKAGSKRLMEYHGNVFKLRCPRCNLRFGRHEFALEEMMQQDLLPPLCTACGSAIKPDVVYFGEQIPADVANRSVDEAERCDLMLICGTSAMVFPFASLPRIASRAGRAKMTEYLFAGWRSPTVKIIEINTEPTPLTHERISDYLIQGKTGEILPRIVEAIKRYIQNGNATDTQQSGDGRTGL